MFGMENKSKGKQPQKFEFDLEKQIRDDKAFCTTLQKHIETEKQSLNQSLKAGSDKTTLDHWGSLLMGYEELERIINRINK